MSYSPDVGINNAESVTLLPLRLGTRNHKVTRKWAEKIMITEYTIKRRISDRTILFRNGISVQNSKRSVPKDSKVGSHVVW